MTEDHGGTSKGVPASQQIHDGWSEVRFLKASRVSLQAVKQRCMPRRQEVQQHQLRTSLWPVPDILLEACSRCRLLPDR